MGELGGDACLFERRVEPGAFTDGIEPVAEVIGVEGFGWVHEVALVKLEVALDFLDDLALMISDLVDVASGDEQVSFLDR